MVQGEGEEVREWAEKIEAEAIAQGALLPAVRAGTLNLETP
jgi:hypothetical protein